MTRSDWKATVVVAVCLLPCCCVVSCLRMKEPKYINVALPVASSSSSISSSSSSSAPDDDKKELFCTPDNVEEFGFCAWTTSQGAECKWERNDTGPCEQDSRLSRIPPFTDCRILINATSVKQEDWGNWTCCVLSYAFPWTSVNFTVHPIERAKDVTIRKQYTESDEANVSSVIRGVENSTVRVTCKFRTKSPLCDVGVSVNGTIVASESVLYDMPDNDTYVELEQDFEITLEADFCDCNITCEVMELDFSGERLYSLGTRSPDSIPMYVDFSPKHVDTNYGFKDRSVQVSFKSNPTPERYVLFLNETNETIHFNDNGRDKRSLDDEEGDGEVVRSSRFRWKLQNGTNHVFTLNLWIREEDGLDEFNRTGWVTVMNAVDKQSFFFRFPKMPPTTTEVATTREFQVRGSVDCQDVNFIVFGSEDQGGKQRTVAIALAVVIAAAVLAALCTKWYFSERALKRHRSRRRRDCSTSSESPLMSV